MKRRDTPEAAAHWDFAERTAREVNAEVETERARCADTAEARASRYQKALEAIRALDFGKTSRGGDDFYTGPDRFIQAWLLANDALSGSPVAAQEKE